MACTSKVSNHCKYSNGKCPHVRAVKSNGELHSLCQLHREIACTSQRRMDQRKAKTNKENTKSVTAIEEISTTRPSSQEVKLSDLKDDQQPYVSLNQEELDYVLLCCSSP